MKNELEILKNWLETATWIYLRKYEWAYTDRIESGVAKNVGLFREAVSFKIDLERAIKLYLKMVKGISLSPKALKWISNLSKII